MILKELKLRIPKSMLVTNCYIIADEENKEAMIIDPGSEAEKVIEMVNLLEVDIKYIFLTHCHFDHIGAVPEVREKLGGKVLISRADYDGLKNDEISLVRFEDFGFDADSRVDDGDVIHVGNLEFKVISTPGHTEGCLCLYNEENKLLFSGDTIFYRTRGRTDLPTGSEEKIINSIKNKILVLPDDVIIYPGHGVPTAVGDERELY
ncbi:MAG: MBL fold metallo-hydrolase [Clostridia bacterium]|nr:MBL fold metallo-hydrolase [Clostridia bacterium]